MGREDSNNDPRHTLLIMPFKEFATKSTGMKADFVFIDSIGDRLSLASHCLTLAPIFAVHDHQAEQLDGLGFKYIRGFNSIVQTVFVSNTVDLSRMKLE